MSILQKILAGGTLRGMLGGFSTRALLIVVGSLFAIDLVVVDPLPFIDEIVLGAMTLLLARWSMRRGETDGESGASYENPAPGPKPPPKNVTPRDTGR